jgi:hypothetical protein
LALHSVFSQKIKTEKRSAVIRSFSVENIFQRGATGEVGLIGIKVKNNKTPT